MQITEYVTLGHPDKVADYISSHILDRYMEKDPQTRYAVECQIKGNVVNLAGEVSSKAHFTPRQLDLFVKAAVAQIGYTPAYQKRWGKENTICESDLKINVYISQQSPDIAQGLDGWGDQGVFFGAAWPTASGFPAEKLLAEKIGRDLAKNPNLGIDVKTLVVTDEGQIKRIVIAVPVLNEKDLANQTIYDLYRTLGKDAEKKIIINGTGTYQKHGPLADCGTTGRKLAVDFYGGFCKIGGGSPWTKDGTKADLTLNLYARYLAKQFIKKNNWNVPVFCDIACAIGRRDIEICLHDGQGTIYKRYTERKKPQDLIKKFKLDTPIYAHLCREGLFSGI